VKLFLDSGAFIARALKDDRYHAAAIGVFEGISKARHPFRLFYTSNYVVDETVTFVQSVYETREEAYRRNAVSASPSLRVLHVSEEVEGEADTAFRRYASSRVSYTDCTTQILMQREGIDTAFSFDRDLETLGFQRIP